MSLAVVESTGTTRRTASAWLLVLGIVLAALNLRTAVTSVGPLLPEVSQDLRLTGFSAGLLTTLPVLTFAAFGALTPAMARRTGEHRLLLIALGAVVAGLVTRSLINSESLFLSASALALAGGAIGNVLIPTLIKRHFPHRIGLLTTVYTTALAMGTMLAAAGAVPIEEAAGGSWHIALGSFAALAVVAAIPWLWLVRREAPVEDDRSEVGPGFLVRSRLAWSVAIYFGSQSLVAYVMFGWLAQFLQDKGFTAAEAGLGLAVFTGFSIPVSMAVPAIAARLRTQRPIVLTFVTLYAVGFAGLLAGPVQLVWVFMTLVAIAMGSFPMALTMFALRTRAAGATAGLSAFAQSIGYLMAGTGPLLVGVLYAATGGWGLPFTLLYAAVAVQLITGWYAGKNRYLEDELNRAVKV